MYHSGISCRGNAESHPRCHSPRKRGIQYSRGVSAQARPSLEYWIARSEPGDDTELGLAAKIAPLAMTIRRRPGPLSIVPAGVHANHDILS